MRVTRAWRRRATLIAAVCGLALGPATASANKLVTITIPDRHREIPAQWLNYYKGPPRANVLLPDGYTPHRRYPLLVLLHGLNGDYDSYAYGGNGGDTVVFKGFPGIVVMPEGADGWYTDWWNNGERGAPAWESYELNEVIPAILARFPILPQRRYHAIAGISMGGLGAGVSGQPSAGASLRLGREPLRLRRPAVLRPDRRPRDGLPVRRSSSTATRTGTPCMALPMASHANGHNPTQLAMNLEHSRVFASTGNGDPSSAEPSQYNANTAALARANPSGGALLTPATGSPRARSFTR